MDAAPFNQTKKLKQWYCSTCRVMVVGYRCPGCYHNPFVPRPAPRAAASKILEAAGKALQRKEEIENKIEEIGLGDEVPAPLWSAYAAGMDKDQNFDAAVRGEFQRLQQEEDACRGDVRQ